VLEVVRADKMAVGHKGSGKHWTNKEVRSRQAAAKKVRRKGPVKLKPPQWLKDDLEAFRVWSAIVKNAKELDLLDNLDANALATFCKLEAQKEKAIKDNDVGLFNRLAKTALAYARSLGLTPDARARLAKKMADGADDPNADLFD
jgi:phage terminase small subunit